MSHQPIVINGSVANGNLQSVQKYIIQNHAPSNGQPNVQVQLVKQEQAQRFMMQRQYLQNPSMQIQTQQEQMQPYWVLAEIECNSDLNSYVLVESKDILGQPQFRELTTGKTISIKIDGSLHAASVVLASDDKVFAYNEYSHMKRMADENLKNREVHVRKRRRTSILETARKDIDEDSSLSGWSGVSQNINTDRVLSPSVHVQQKVTSYKQSELVAPMTFHQGTQTDNRLSGTSGLQDKIQELQRLVELNEHMLNDQKLLRSEVVSSRMLIENFIKDFSAMRSSMEQMGEKIDSMITTRGQFDDISHLQSSDKKKVLNGTTQPYVIIENTSENASFSMNGSNLEYTVEELEADDSGRSTSRMSFHDQTSMMSNSSMDFIVPKKEPFRRSHSSSNFLVNSTSSTPITRVNSNSSLTDEFADVEGDFMIGSNKTMVPIHVLRSIDWKNYKTATRKLLITLFTREILATRSLTGRPSPAFHDRDKPVKGKLDQDIINDIIQMVTKKCLVQESQVRTAITTKCADENKMMRNRKENESKEKFKTPGSASGSKGAKDEVNKENMINN